MYEDVRQCDVLGKLVLTLSIVLLAWNIDPFSKRLDVKSCNWHRKDTLELPNTIIKKREKHMAQTENMRVWVTARYPASAFPLAIKQ